MIFVSTSCLKGMGLKEAIGILYGNGFSNIELSGTFDYYTDLERDLLELKSRHNLNLMCHNYFPPAEIPFVLNVASLDEDTYRKSLEHLKKAVDLSKRLGAVRFSFHAGFYTDLEVHELNRTVKYRRLFDKEKCTDRFCKGFDVLKKHAGKGLELYVENNVISYDNLNVFRGTPPFMLARHEEYEGLRKLIDFKLLLDIGHLKVSANSLGLDFEEELERMMSVSDYLHVNNNDGFLDEHRAVSDTRSISENLNKDMLKSKVITLEMSDGMDSIRHSYRLLEGVI